MAKKQRYQLMKFSGYIGVLDTKAKKRLENLIPTKRLTVKRPASAYESGYTFMESTDLHERLGKRRTVSAKELGKLRKRFHG